MAEYCYCLRRQLDLERIKNYFEANGLVKVERPEDADYVVMMCCQSGEAKLKDSIRTAANLAERISGRKLILGGCLPKYARETPKVKEMTLFSFAPKEGIQTFDKYFESTTEIIHVADGHFIPRNENIFNLRVQDGCLGKCIYCGIRGYIGKTKSKSLDEITGELTGLTEKTALIRITGDDIGTYGRDISSSLPKLIDTLLPLIQGRQIALDNLNIRDLIKYECDLLPLAKAGVFFHIVAATEHGVPRLLKAMRRYSNTLQIEETMCHFLSTRVHFMTHFLVGFPSETSEELKQGMDFVTKRVPFGRVKFLRYTPNAISINETKRMRLEPVTEIEKQRRMQEIYCRLQEFGEVVRFGEIEQGVFQTVELRRPEYNKHCALLQ